MSSVVAKARKEGILAVKEASTSALKTGVILSAVVADPYALPLGPRGNAGAQFIEPANTFVPRNPRILKPRPEPFLHKTSLWQTPQASTLIRTWPAPG